MLRIAVSAGELSGDEHAANLARAILAQNPLVEFRGMGGRNLQAAGMQLVVNSEKSAAFMGFARVVKGLRKILDTLATMKSFLREWKPDVLILVDYPDFNLRLARFAHAHGIKVFYFIPPKMWAWRSGRVKLFKKYVDQAALIFPFEQKFFEKRGYKNATFVGHPFVEQISRRESSLEERARFCATLGIPDSGKILALLPGSRWFEIEQLLLPSLEALKILAARHPDLMPVVSVAPSIDPEKLRKAIGRPDAVKFFTGDSLELMRHSHVGVIKSGTSNLQAAFCNLPFVMLYRTSIASEIIVKSLVRLKEYSLVNILRPNTVVELTQRDANAERIAAEVEQLLGQTSARQAMLAGFSEIAASLAAPAAVGAHPESAMQRAAKLALNLANSQNP